MARPLRIDIENGLYHLTSRGWERRLSCATSGTGSDGWNCSTAWRRAAGYRGSMILEPNPDRVAPDGIRRSAAYLRQRVRELDLNV